MTYILKLLIYFMSVFDPETNCAVNTRRRCSFSGEEQTLESICVNCRDFGKLGNRFGFYNLIPNICKK